MEFALKRLDGVDKVVISIERQQFVVFYKPNASFQPKLIRNAVAQSGVEVVKFQVQAKGTVQKQGSDRIFISGIDKYLIAAGPQMPLNTPVIAGGDILDDSKLPYKFKVLDFKPLPKP